MSLIAAFIYNNDNGRYVVVKDIADAIEYVKTNTGSYTISLINDVKENITIPADVTVTLDLNGKTLTGANSCASGWGNLENQNKYTAIVNKGTLIIEDSSKGKTGHVTAGGELASALYTDAGATTTLAGGTFTTALATTEAQKTTQQGNWYVIRNHGTMTMNNGVKVTCGGNYMLSGNGFITNGYEQFENEGKEAHLANDAVMTINGGTYEGGIFVVKNGDWDGVMTINDGTFSIAGSTAGSASNWGAVVSNSNNCTMTINGGTFTGATGGLDPIIKAKTKSAVNEGSGLTIKGGTFSGDNDVLQTLNKANSASPAAIINISAGHFKGKINNNTEATGEGASRSYEVGASELSISGGYFSSDPGAYIPQNAGVVCSSFIESDDNSGHTIYKVGAPVAFIGSTGYSTVQSAIESVTGNSTTINVIGIPNGDENMNGAATLESILPALVSRRVWLMPLLSVVGRHEHRYG